MGLLDPPAFPLSAEAKAVFGRSVNPTDPQEAAGRQLTGSAFEQNITVFHGDSMIEWYLPPTGLGGSIPEQLLARTGWIDSSAVTNMAIASDTAGTIVAQLANLDDNIVAYPDRGWLIILVGHNDLNAGVSAVTLEGRWQAIAASYRARNFKILLLTPPSVGSFSAPKVAERTAATAWAVSQEGIIFDIVISLADLTEANTFDNTHLTVAGNAIVVDRIVARLPQPFLGAKQLAHGEKWRGRSEGITESKYEPALALKTDPDAGNRIIDTNAAYSTLVTYDGVNVYDLNPPAKCGVYVGSGGVKTVAPLLSSISIQNTASGLGDFTIMFWLAETGRAALSGSNPGPILTTSANESFGLVGGSGKGYMIDNSGNNYNWNNLPALRPEHSEFLVFRRSGSTVRALINGLSGVDTVFTGALSFDRLFGRATTAFLQANALEIVVKSGFLSNRQIEEIRLGRGAEINKGVGTALWLDFSEGFGYQAFDKSGNGRHATMPADATWTWLYPRRSGQIRAPLVFGGAGNAQLLGQVCAATDTVVQDLWITSSGSATIQVGTASGGAQIAASQPIVSGVNHIVLTTSPVVTSGSIWVNSSAAVTLQVTASAMRTIL